jgi:hypothetical protein
VKEHPILFSAPMVRAILAGTKTQTRRIVKPQPVQPVERPLKHTARHAGSYFDAYCSERKTDENPRGMSDRWCWWTADDRPDPLSTIRCRYGAPGDELWVRETWYCDNTTAPNWNRGKTIEPTADLVAEWRESMYYRADAKSRDELAARARPECACSEFGGKSPWRPSIHMPRWASRIALDVTGVRVERLHDITDADAKAEGAAWRIDTGGDLNGAFSHVDTPIGYRNHFRDLWKSINGAASWDANPWVWVIEFKRVQEQAVAA